MRRVLRVSIFGTGILCLILTFGFVLRAPWATGLWPFAMKETRLGFIFLGSIAAAIAAPTIWIGLTGEVRAAEAGGINLLVTFGGMTIFLAGLGLRSGQPELLPAAVACAIAGGLAAAVLVLARRVPWQDRRPMPAPVRYSFGLFAVVLILVGGALVSAVAHVFPWPLAPESSVMYGFIFLGAATYFIHGFYRPMWANAAGQLVGFLAYDLILIGPFLMHFSAVRPAHRLSLIIYTAVLIYSGALAVYYLFIDRSTRTLLNPAPDARQG